MPPETNADYCKLTSVFFGDALLPGTSFLLQFMIFCALILS